MGFRGVASTFEQGDRYNNIGTILCALHALIQEIESRIA
jgi:hypothetical protein